MSRREMSREDLIKKGQRLAKVARERTGVDRIIDEGLQRVLRANEKAAAGNSADRLWAFVEAEGWYLPTSVLRNSTLGGMEIKRKNGNGENLVIIGCHCFGTLMPVRSFFLLLEYLGVGYQILRKEYCCGAPGLDGNPNVQDIWDHAKHFIGLNIAQGRELGAKRTTHLCYECAYLARSFYPEEEDIYYPDLFLRVLQGRKLRLTGSIAYYPGCLAASYVLAPHRDWEFNHEGYRSFLDTIEGLRIADLPDTCCRLGAPETIYGKARSQGITTLVTPCMPCYGRMVRHKPSDMRLLGLSDLLLAALGQPDPHGLRWTDGALLEERV